MGLRTVGSMIGLVDWISSHRSSLDLDNVFGPFVIGGVLVEHLSGLGLVQETSYNGCQGPQCPGVGPPCNHDSLGSPHPQFGQSVFVDAHHWSTVVTTAEGNKRGVHPLMEITRTEFANLDRLNGFPEGLWAI
jgi:hypothetical protein